MSLDLLCASSMIPTHIRNRKRNIRQQLLRYNAKWIHSYTYSSLSLSLSLAPSLALPLSRSLSLSLYIYIYALIYIHIYIYIYIYMYVSICLRSTAHCGMRVNFACSLPFPIVDCLLRLVTCCSSESCCHPLPYVAWNVMEGYR